MRPASGEYGAEDGTSYATAFDGFADVTWAATDTAGSVDAGDTLVVCGSFGAESTDGGGAIMLSVGASGTDNEPIIIDGDCSAQGDLSQAVIDPGNDADVNRGLYTAANTDIQLKNMLVRNVGGANETFATGVGVGANSTQHSTDVDILIDNVDVSGIGLSGLGEESDCMTLFGTDITVQNSTLADCWDDGIYVVGANPLIKDNTISVVSVGTDGGDCVQSTGATTLNNDGALLSGNSCDHSDKDAKQCYVLGEAGDSPTRSAVDNNCLLPIGATVSNGILITSGTATVARNYIVGGNAGIQANSGTLVTIAGNIVRKANQYGIRAGSSVTAATIANNSISETGQGTTDPVMAITSDVNTADHKIQNNSVNGSTGAGIDRQGTTAIESNNSVYGSTTTASLNCTSATCATESTTLDASGSTADPKYVGGPNPNTAEGFRLSASSPLRATGTYVGSLQDHGNRRFKFPPSIGAWEAAAGDAAESRTARGQ